MKHIERSLIAQALFLSSFLVYTACFFGLLGQSQYGKLVELDEQVRKDLVPLGSLQSKSLPFRNGRLVLMLIDAMRHDFVFEQEKNARMPFINRLIQDKKALPFKLNARPPTVTLPRLKAIVSGIIPEFIDILWNFNTTSLVEDSILDKFRASNKSIIFYGDDTWLKLFEPSRYFLRFEGTTSFIASDFDEVDFNVTRHLEFELKQQDWKVMILHYLGLDHVGHIEGPFAPYNIRRKLHEMDEVIRRIYNELNEDDLLLVLSDHGMANEGGHGGSSRMELETPAVFVSKSSVIVTDDQLDVRLGEQIDLSSTLSCLFDLDVPVNSKGVSFAHKLVKDQTVGLKCLIKTINQLNRQYSVMNDAHQLEDLIRRAFKLVEETRNIKLGDLNQELESLVRDKTSSLTSEKSKDDGLLISTLLAALLSFLIFISVGAGMESSFKLGIIIQIPIALVISTYRPLLGLGLLSIAMLVQIKYFLGEKYANIKASMSQVLSYKKIFYFSVIVNVASLFSSSFIEEEHQIWYFLEITYLYLILVGDKSTKDRNFLFDTISLLVLTRFTRSINQTGNKWIHLKDLGDFLKENSSKIPLNLVALVSLGVVYNAEFRAKKSIAKVCLGLVYFYHLTINFDLFTLYQRNLIAKLNYLIILIFILIELNNIRQASSRSRLELILRALSQTFVLLNCLIQPSHNLLIVVSWVLKSQLINRTIQRNKHSLNLAEILYFHFIVIGHSFHFAQGNSNSLNTIQISSGLVGINTMNPLLIGFILFIATYSSTIYCFLNTAVTLIQSESSPTRVKKSLNNLVFFQLLFISSSSLFYLLSSYMQREHLFVWSVFAPKLIYLLAETLVNYTLALLFSALFYATS